MNQNDLKTKIAEMLHRNASMLDRIKGGGGTFVHWADLTAMLDSAAANLAQALPEMLVSAGHKINRADYIEMREERDRMRELCKHAYAALMMVQDFKPSPLTEDLKKACGDE